MPHDPDPLLTFLAESPAVGPPDTPEHAKSVSQGEPAEAAETIEKSARSVITPQDPPANAPVAADDDAHLSLSRRLERAERLLDRSLVEIAALKSDQATLVTTLDDIRKRQSRVEILPAHVVPPAARRSYARSILTAVLLVASVGLGWGVMSMASDDVPEPPIASTPEPTNSPTPVVDVAPSRPDPEPPPSAAAVAVPAVAVPAVAAPAREAQPVRDRPARPRAPPVAGYVGTLTIDSSPDGEVFVDRKSVGRSPVRLENLRAGSHLIWIERDGYRRWTRVVAVGADRVSRVSATLDSLAR